MKPQSITLLQKIDLNVEQILAKFQNIFDILINTDKTREQLAVELLTIELDALAIIRFCEDLLNISRGLKEQWVLGSMKVDTEKDTYEVDTEKVFRQFNQLTEEITKFETAKTDGGFTSS